MEIIFIHIKEKNLINGKINKNRLILEGGE
jgi:hypothetical protein